MKIERLYNILQGTKDTEKSLVAADALGKITFKVCKKATKTEIKHAVEKLFNVSVQAVNIINVRGKIKRYKQIEGRRPGWKKALVTIAAGQDINVYDFE
jgi:large subunit ribosomal protein L23